MAFLDFLSGKIKCPNCGTEGARKSGDGYKCTNPRCQWFDSGVAPSESSHQVMTPGGMSVNFTSGSTIAIRYRNFKGEEKTFNVDRESAVRVKNHWSVKTASGGVNAIALSRDRIQNLNEVEAALPQRLAPGQAYPTPRERQVLGFHKKYKTTSPLYEKIRAKYPNW
jgi:hypothetical protein